MNILESSVFLLQATTDADGKDKSEVSQERELRIIGLDGWAVSLALWILFT